MSSSRRKGMGLFFPGPEGGGHGGDRGGLLAGSAPGGGLGGETLGGGAENQTFQTLLMDCLCMSVGRGSARCVSGHMVHPETQGPSLLFDLRRLWAAARRSRG